ncbi:hypothetical protein N7G274_004764 [Stereocaulon virgatum]|uniref:Voltage-gated hydrogen channel 1 n=1 Tax=Stereocaulon virgatum TaxID=373712 RepID=A0ABR4ABP4_9LECA
MVVSVSYDNKARKQTKRFLSSKYGHYAVLLLVSLDVSCIFADFLISLFICDHTCAKGEPVSKKLPQAQDALGIVSLVFSCLFMVELLASIWAFGLEYFKSKFHCFDATIIIAGFVIDVCLKGVLEEAGSIVVILRLWRVFKIVEEFSAGASDEMDHLTQRNEKLENENADLKRELKTLKANEDGQ